MIEDILLSPVVAYIASAALIITALAKKVFITVEEGDPGYKRQTRFLPLLSFTVGFLGTLLLFIPVTGHSILAAILVGGSASGVYDLIKKTILGR